MSRVVSSFAGPVVAAVAGYAVGLFPTAELVARRHAADLHQLGSGNPGAANAAAELGAKAGLEVMAGDIAKGVLAGRIGSAVAGDIGIHVAATAAVVGHCYPATKPGRGGKGVATSVGQVLVAFPVYFPIDAAVAIGTAAIPSLKERAFVATATASVVWVASAMLWHREGWTNAWGPPVTRATTLSALVSSLVIAERFKAAERRPDELPTSEQGAQE